MGSWYVNSGEFENVTSNPSLSEVITLRNQVDEIQGTDYSNTLGNHILDLGILAFGAFTSGLGELLSLAGIQETYEEDKLEIELEAEEDVYTEAQEILINPQFIAIELEQKMEKMLKKQDYGTHVATVGEKWVAVGAPRISKIVGSDGTIYR